MVVSKGKSERLRAIGRPHVLEDGCVPEGFISELWHTDWVRCWAWSSRLEGLLCCAEHVALVVRRVEVLAIPASSISLVPV
jgi:hypothetical protein